VPFDHAYAVAGRAQLVSGGDADDPAADDYDIHVEFVLPVERATAWRSPLRDCVTCGAAG
jgi:hypothetical protein